MTFVTFKTVIGSLKQQAVSQVKLQVNHVQFQIAEASEANSSWVRIAAENLQFLSKKIVAVKNGNYQQHQIFKTKKS